ncbi:rhamnose-binding lectin-like [Scomber japonicus]|uniref:rhamnose-binding lectin-like n=1 Tax=Scomber japonicus TaxID=13676 RepID=UPI00230626DE|nr:rhamnose-binding lectin-like [Scomber japonicus]
MLRFSLSSTLLLAATCLFTAAVTSTERIITCDDGHSVQRLSCEIGVISVEASLYGRADSKTCSEGRPAHQLANTKCSQPGTVDILKKRCDGKKVCELNTGAVRISDPCYGIFKYLETNYTCFPAIHLVVCENSLAQLYCDGGQVILVYGADYGRHDSTTCSYQRPPAQVRNTYCSNPGTKVAESCNGKSSCTIRASNSVFGDPCVGTYKYLEVAYTCQYPHMLCFRLSSSLLLAAACLLVTAGFSAAQPMLPLRAVSTERVVTCDDLNNVQRLSCETGVIIVQTALYGRVDKETCSEHRPAHQLTNTKCSQRGTLQVIKQRCDGKKDCEINTNVVRTSDPCYGIYKYLDVTFACLPAVRTVACEHSVANLQCDEGQVLFVLGADYGRRDKTTCSFQRPASQIQNVHCSKPTSKVAESCNGKSSCTVKASNSVFGDPCVGTYKYLEVAYRCQQKQKIITVLMCDSNDSNVSFSVLAATCLFTAAGFSRAQSLPPRTAESTKRVITCDDNDNVQRLSCAKYSVISVQKALYGREDKVTCSQGRPAHELSDTECCQEGTLEVIQKRCDGKTDCEINTNVVHTGDPCYGTYKYLDITYTCLPPGQLRFCF